MATWQGEVKGIMYSEGITNREIAHKLELTESYISKLFTGKVRTVGAEDRIRTAVAEIIAERGEQDDEG